MTDSWFKRTFNPGAVVREDLERQVETLTTALTERDRRLATLAMELGEAESAVQRGKERLQESRRSVEYLRTSLQKAAPSIREVEALRGMIAKVEWALGEKE